MTAQADAQHERDAGARTIAWFHCFAGIAGDMAFGSLLDAGADLAEVRRLIERLPLGGWRLDVEPVMRGGIAATRAIVSSADDVVVRTYAHIVGLVGEARLPPRVTHRALAAFEALATVEGRLHRRPVEHVHFHEVGGHDTVVEVVGVAAALEVLDVAEVRSSPVATGTGMVRTSHGLLPNPAPAVVGLLEGVPTWGRNLPFELTTPTGAALVAALSSGFGPMPPLRVTGQGFGAGSRDLEELPNCTQAVLGLATGPPFGAHWATGPSSVLAHQETADHPGGMVLDAVQAEAGQPVALLETNVDDVTGEQLAHAVAVLLEAGALDAWLSPVVMKKGRPGSVVHVLADLSNAVQLGRVLRRTTGSLGVRMVVAARWPAARRTESVVVDGQPIRVKVSADSVKAEHEDVAAAARRTGGNLRDLARRAEAEWLVRADRFTATRAGSGDPADEEGHRAGRHAEGVDGGRPRGAWPGGRRSGDDGTVDLGNHAIDPDDGEPA